jgi:hypothetical protein
MVYGTASEDDGRAFLRISLFVFTLLGGNWLYLDKLPKINL